jgi:hypothetical protein
MCELPGVEPPAIGANPLADCTSNPSGVEGTKEREMKRGEGRIPYFDPPCSFLTTRTLNISAMFVALRASALHLIDP